MRIHKLIASQVFTLTILFSLHTPAMAKVETHECSSDSSAKICQTQRTPKKNNKHSGTSSTGDNIVTEIITQDLRVKIQIRTLLKLPMA